MPEMKRFIDRVLETRGCPKRYHSRIKRFPNLAQHADLPLSLDEISNDEAPWYCHGLAFRMATYPSANDNLFARWDKLLKLPDGTEDWELELKNWVKNGDHWARKWDKFYHFLWLLQCFEYFKRSGHQVTFSMRKNGPATDLEIERNRCDSVFVECTVYSKWWFNEAFLGDILGILEPELFIRRIHNLKPNDYNSFSQKEFPKTLRRIANCLRPDLLLAAKAETAKASPHLIFESETGDFQILLDGEGEYQPDLNNAHGAPELSLPNFLKEIIKAKKDKNNLKKSRPNILMVNGLGVDFQAALIRNETDVKEFDNSAIDEIWLAACGIDDKLRCTNFKKILRQQYEGSGL